VKAGTNSSSETGMSKSPWLLYTKLNYTSLSPLQVYPLYLLKLLSILTDRAFVYGYFDFGSRPHLMHLRFSTSTRYRPETDSAKATPTLACPAFLSLRAFFRLLVPRWWCELYHLDSYDSSTWWRVRPSLLSRSPEFRLWWIGTMTFALQTH